MKSLIYPILAQTFQQQQCQYNRNTIHCIKPNCFQEILNSSDMYLCWVPNVIDPLCTYLFLEINAQKSSSSVSMVFHNHLPVMYLPEFQPHFSLFIIWPQPNPCLIFRIYYARCSLTSTSVHQYKFPVSASTNIFKHSHHKILHRPSFSAR